MNFGPAVHILLRLHALPSSLLLLLHLLMLLMMAIVVSLMRCRLPLLWQQLLLMLMMPL